MSIYRITGRAEEATLQDWAPGEPLLPQEQEASLLSQLLGPDPRPLCLGLHLQAGAPCPALSALLTQHKSRCIVDTADW